MIHNPLDHRFHAALALGAGLAASLALAPHAAAQLAIPWSTVDGGGGTSTSGVFAVTGTIGQPDAGPAVTGMAGGTLVIAGGYWPGRRCAADFNNSGGLEVQDIFDFLNAWFALDPRADFNGVDGVSVQDIFDFINAWLAGCP